MAITLLTGTPGTPGTDNGSTATVSFTIPSTVPDGTPMIAIHCNDFRDISNMVAPVLTGFSPVMNLLGVADGGLNLSHIKVWGFVYPTGATGTARVLSCTETGSHDGDKGLTVYALSGADAATFLDGALVATSSPSVAVASFVLGALSPANTDSLRIDHIRTSNGAGTASIAPHAGNTATQRYSVANFTRIYGATQQLAASGSTGTYAYDPATSVPYVAVSFAVKAAGGGGTTINGTAALAGAGALSAVVTEQVKATLTGAGTLAGAAVQAATATLAGAGTLVSAVTQRATATPTGAGALAATAVQTATATPTGAGALSSTAVQAATAAPTGAGVLSSAAVQTATATLTGAGALTASSAGTVSGTAALAGAGALTVSVVQQATATPTAAGALTSSVTQRATAALVGAGALAASSAGTVNGTASLTGAGTLAASVTQSATAALVGAGSVVVGTVTQGFWGVHL